MRKLIKAGLVGMSLYLISAVRAQAPGIDKSDLERALLHIQPREIIANPKAYEPPPLELPRPTKNPVYLRDPSTLEEIREYVQFKYASMEFPSYVPPEFFVAIIRKESGNDKGLKPNRKAIGTSGERGLMQIMPKTWQITEEKSAKDSTFKKDAFDSSRNIDMGMSYVKRMLRYCERANPKWRKLTAKERRNVLLIVYNSGTQRLTDNNWNTKNTPQRIVDYVNRVNEFLAEELAYKSK
jgi:soluble lytic murein transglycosylase-like protein